MYTGCLTKVLVRAHPNLCGFLAMKSKSSCHTWSAPRTFFNKESHVCLKYCLPLIASRKGRNSQFSLMCPVALCYLCMCPMAPCCMSVCPVTSCCIHVSRGTITACIIHHCNVHYSPVHTRVFCVTSYAWLCMCNHETLTGHGVACIKWEEQVLIMYILECV